MTILLSPGVLLIIGLIAGAVILAVVTAVMAKKSTRFVRNKNSINSIKKNGVDERLNSIINLKNQQKQDIKRAKIVVEKENDPIKQVANINLQKNKKFKDKVNSIIKYTKRINEEISKKQTEIKKIQIDTSNKVMNCSLDKLEEIRAIGKLQVAKVEKEIVELEAKKEKIRSSARGVLSDIQQCENTLER